ncbi:MAG: secretin and TonB N-terminal domain-containing protein [Bacteroidota bacterium]
MKHVLVIIMAAVIFGRCGFAQSQDSNSQQELVLPPGAKDTTSLNFKDADLRDIFRALSYQHGINIFLDNSINKRATISLNRVPVYDIVKFLCQQNKLNLQIDGNIIKITQPGEAPPPPPKVPQVTWEAGLLSVELKNDDLEKVILEIQKKTGKNILVISGTTGSVNGKLMEIDFDIGFTQLMNNNGFAVQKKSGVYIVSRLDYYVGTQGTSSAQRSGPYWISVKDSSVSIDVTNAPLERVLHDMIRQLNTDVVFYNQISGTVTARATNVSLSRAMDLLLRNTNYAYRESEGMYFIGEKANKALVATRLLRLKYLTAEGTIDMLPQNLTTQATIKMVKEQNGLVIIGSPDVVEQVEEFLAQIDKPVAQVLIEAIVVDFDVSKGSEFGIQAGTTGGLDTTTYTRKGSLIPGIDYEMKGDALSNYLNKIGKVSLFGTELNIAKLGPLPPDFYLNIKALESQGLANIKSRPVIATLNGHKASLSIGTTQYFLLESTIPYRDQTSVLFQTSRQFQTIEADVKLEITPYVGADGLITVEVKPDFRTPVGQFSSTVPPTINKRAMSSTLIVREGETIVLGGLVQETESDVRSQTPILGSIPLLGSLFSSTTKSSRKSELMIYITPHISYGEAFDVNLTPPAGTQ